MNDLTRRTLGTADAWKLLFRWQSVPGDTVPADVVVKKEDGEKSRSKRPNEGRAKSKREEKLWEDGWGRRREWGEVGSVMGADERFVGRVWEASRRSAPSNRPSYVLGYINAPLAGRSFVLAKDWRQQQRSHHAIHVIYALGHDWMRRVRRSGHLEDTETSSSWNE